ncbi:nucleotidyltransferase domain-containing protein [Thermococcus sp. SY098]|uniref:nucleotidyltransferase domain-containing protein n=1 Tax=Thermococcus sp. SY098 TaxID=3111325 RepID=UPI002D794D6F|nr:nucleotidyltransferase domain-containing protein [Thermococcus sp. SY098]WRS52668.1 nucleotidyltransferase domain-containing protein [Thermococcus sp. SY098]
MIAEFRKFAGFKILEYFLLNPTKEIHLKELSRELNISPSTVKHYCDVFVKDNILSSRRIGNLKIFKLNNENFAVREIKRAYMILKLKELGIENLCSSCHSLAIYGSTAAGTFDERSDIDILIIGDESLVNYPVIKRIEKNLGKEIQLTVFQPHEWEIMKRNKNPLANEILRNHVLIKGVPL